MQHQAGHSEPSTGPNELKAGHLQEHTKGLDVESRSHGGVTDIPSRTRSDHNQTHNRTITEEDLPLDLVAVIEAWPELAEEVRAEILKMARKGRRRS